MDNLAKQSEILFMWDARMCNPNGDMGADNSPRFDDVDEKAIVSDVRVKRTVRDDLQYRKEETIYINNEEILSKDEALKISLIDKRVFKGEIVQQNEDIIINGEIANFHTIKFPIRDTNNTIIGLCGISRDITNLKKTEKQLLEYHKQLQSLADRKSVV